MNYYHHLFLLHLRMFLLFHLNLQQQNMNLLVRGDNLAKYPAFKNIKSAFKRNDVYKFKIVTNPEGVPTDSELYRNPPVPGK